MSSLRPLIAEILVAQHGSARSVLAGQDGAATLAWCDEHELKGMPSRAEMVDELEELRQLVEEIGGAVESAKGGLAARVREILAI